MLSQKVVAFTLAALLSGSSLYAVAAGETIANGPAPAGSKPSGAGQSTGSSSGSR